MATPTFRDEILAATETRRRDFKAAMSWSSLNRCDRFECLKDIAALANTPGGGYLIIGRNEPDYRTGGLSSEQVETFDPTDVNGVVAEYLTPKHECFVEIHDLAGERVVVIFVPEFRRSPLICSKDPQCVGCRRLQRSTCLEVACADKHFRRGQIYVRTEASQTVLLEDPLHVDDLLQLALDKKQEVFERQFDRIAARREPELRREYEALLSRMPAFPPGISIASDVVSPTANATPDAAAFSSTVANDPDEHYRTETDEDDEYLYRGVFYPLITTIGRFDLGFIPGPYRPDRIDLRALRNVANTLIVTHRQGTVPLTATSDFANFDVGIQAEHRFGPHREALRLHASGLYRLVRLVPDDVGDDGMFILDMSEHTIGFRYSIAVISSMYLLSRNLARLLCLPNETGQFRLRVAGMSGRRTVADTAAESPATMLTLAPAKASTKDAYDFVHDVTAGDTDAQMLDLALRDLVRFFWPFNLSGLEPELKKWQSHLFPRGT